jgi:hypothetical protein
LLLRGGERASVAGGVVVLGYVAAVVGSATLGALQFRQLRVGALAAPSLVATQVAYLAGFVRGLTR